LRCPGSAMPESFVFGRDAMFRIADPSYGGGKSATSIFFRASFTRFCALSPPQSPGAPHLARFSRDVGYRRPCPQACCGPHSSVRVPHVRTSVARISCHAALATTTHAAFSQRKPHEIAQRHQPRQEIRDTWAEKDGRSPSTAFRSGPYPSFVALGDIIGFPGCTPRVPLSSVVLRAHCG